MLLVVVINMVCNSNVRLECDTIMTQPAQAKCTGNGRLLVSMGALLRHGTMLVPVMMLTVEMRYVQR